MLKQGGHGEVTEVTHRGKTYIAKRGIYKKRKNAKELKFGLRAAALGIGPKIVYHDDALIIMERFEETLRDYLVRTTPKAAGDTLRSLTTAEMDELVALFETCYKDGWQHNDNSLLNVMRHKGKFYLIDFGESRNWKCLKRVTPAEREEAIRKAALTIDLQYLPNWTEPRAFHDAISDYVEAHGYLTSMRKHKYMREGRALVPRKVVS